MRRYSFIIGLLSATVLATEVALTRIFAYLIWYHGVFLVISMVLLGFAASGSLLTLGENIFQKRPGQWIRAGALIYSFLLFLGVFMPGFVPLESEGVSLRSIQQIRNLAIYFVYWGFTFMMAGMAIVLILQHARERIHQVYFSSMVGSGFGCLLAVGLLYLGPTVTLNAMALIAILTAIIVPVKTSSRLFWGGAVLLLVGICITLLGIIRPVWHVAPSKIDFYQFAKGTIRETHWSPISVVQVFDGPSGWRYWDTGLAIHCRGVFPQQKGIIIDAFAQSAFTDWHDRNLQQLDFFSSCSTSAAYALRQHPRVLVLGIGGGIDILRALYFDAQSVVGIELNGVLVDLIRGPYRKFTGDLAFHPKVTLVKDEGRSYVKHSSDNFDVIQINYTDTWSATSSGALALAENFLYTSEAIQDYYHRLSDSGILSITRFLARPYRETLRVVLTAMKAMQDLDIPEPKRHMLAVVSVMGYGPEPHMNATLLVSKKPFTTDEVERLSNIGRGKWLILFRPDNIPLPPIMPVDAPLSYQYYRLVKEKLDEARTAYASFMAGFLDDTSVIDAYEFDVSPLTDNRPYYYFFYRWKDVWHHFINGAISGDAGGVVLLYTLFLALVGSIIGIFIPLGIWQRRYPDKVSGVGVGTGWYAAYFAGLGFGYILIELNLIQRFSLFLGHPVYALSVTLAGLLILSGVGSYLSQCIKWRLSSLLIIFFAIILSIVFSKSLPKILFQILAGRPVWMRAMATLITIVPLGIFMGMPFPLCLRQVGHDKPRLIPWLWGINGFTSVLGSVSATMLAISYGYNSVTATAIVAYAGALIAGVFLTRNVGRDHFME